MPIMILISLWWLHHWQDHSKVNSPITLVSLTAVVKKIIKNVVTKNNTNLLLNHCRRSEVWSGFYSAEIQISVELSSGSRKKSTSLLFQFLEDGCIPGSWSHFSIFEASSVASLGRFPYSDIPVSFWTLMMMLGGTG